MKKQTFGLVLFGMLMACLGFALASVTSDASPQKQPPRPAHGRRVINLPNRTVQAPFSDGILVGDTLYLAGRIGLDTNNKPPADVEQEAKMVLDGMQSVLKEAGMTMDDLVTVTVYCPDVSLFNKFNGVYRTYYKSDFPARAFIGSGPLLFGGHFEVQGIAVRPQGAGIMPLKAPQ
jgi:enamine deaminase RidA (YjgF/YER057c/UK114 family)